MPTPAPALPPIRPKTRPSVARRRRRLTAVLSTVCCIGALIMTPLQAHATPASSASSSTASPGKVSAQRVCGDPKPGQYTCFSFRRTDVQHGLGVQRPSGAQAVTAPEGYGPADLRSAYNLPDGGGAGATIAIVDAYDDPTAEADLAVYRQQYGLPACTSDGGCFRKVDERGGADYPQPDADWAGEISLDLDMVSAIAPQAHILLVEADSPADADLGSAENMAVSLGAEYVSNSWGGYDDTSSNLAEDEAYFNHPGTAIVFSSGDDGYGVSYPAASPYVTAVGGTSLRRDSSTRGWSESVWNSVASKWGAPGSGCSVVEPKPSFQSDPGCDGRSVADVSAVADPRTGVAIYDSYSGGGGWNVYGGTSASAPIIAGVYALAGSPEATTYPSSYPYETPGALNDVTTGDDASCAAGVGCGFGTTPDCTPSYECAAARGYDGPTGLGTPDGVAAFRPGPHGSVAGTVTDSATGKPIAGATVRLGQYQTATGSDGTYRFDVPSGSYDLTVTAYGYAPHDFGTVDLADGTSLTENAALVAVPSVTVSGTVSDGGGHGWGLYAKITLDGVPGTVFTDPATGHYSVKVPMDATYTLHADALYPGYRERTDTVSVAAADRTANLALPIDTTGTLPPGYLIDYHGGEQQSFDTAATPSGWTVKNNTSAGGWNFDDPLNRGNQTGGSGRFAEVDDYALGWKQADTELISPSYDFSAETSPELDFDTALPSTYRLDGLTADVDVSTDHGANWTNVWEQTGVVNGPAHEVVSLAAYAGQPSVQVRFHFVGGLTGIWEIDDVGIGTRTLQTVPGGLLVGRVSDANTGAGVVGATVQNVVAASDSGRSVVSPGDPAQGDGLYWLFASHTGRQRFSADLAGFGYPAVTSSVDIKANAIATADFRLHPAQLRFEENSVTDTVPWGESKRATVTVRNTGGSPATISLGEDRAAPAATGSGAAVQRVTSTVTPNALSAGLPAASATAAARSAGSGAATGQAWQPLADLPTGNFAGIAAVNDGILYTGFGEAPGGQWSKGFYSYDPGTSTWTALASPDTTRIYPAYGFIRGKLYVTGGRDAAGNPISGGEVYDPATDTWSQIADVPYAYGGSGSAVIGDKLYVVGGCDFGGCGYTHVQIYDPASDTWSQGPSYPTPISFASCGAIDSVLYCAGGAYEPAGAGDSDTADAYALDPTVGSWKRVADAPLDFWGATSTAADGLLLSAGGQQISAGQLTNGAYSYDPATNSWSTQPNLPDPLIGAASAPGWYVLGGANSYNVPQPTALKLPGFDQPHGGVSWLSATTKSLTIGAGKKAKIKLQLDASAFGPADVGDHLAKLIVDSDTPYGSISLPVRMTVAPPADWGLLSGTVTGKSSDGSTAPLPGAVVEVDTKNGDFTLQAGADGRYQLWLPAEDNPLTVIVSATGYRPATRSVTIAKGGGVTADFALIPR